MGSTCAGIRMGTREGDRKLQPLALIGGESVPDRSPWRSWYAFVSDSIYRHGRPAGCVPSIQSIVH